MDGECAPLDGRGVEESLLHVQEEAHKNVFGNGGVCKKELITIAGYLRRWMVNAPHWTEEAWKFPFSTCKKELIKVSKMVFTEVDGECSLLDEAWKFPFSTCKKELIKVAGTYGGGW